MTCMVHTDMVCSCEHKKREILVSEDEELPTEIRMLKYLCSKDGDPVESGTNVWQEVLYNFKNKRMVPKKCCMKGTCQKERAVCELLRFMKIMRSNMEEVRKYRPADAVDEKNSKYTSVEPTFVLAHLSAKLLQFEKRLKTLNCSKRDTCRLALLIRKVKQAMLVQFISGPKQNDALANIVRDVAYIDCLFKRLEKLCCCKEVQQQLPAEAGKQVIVLTEDIGVNTEPMLTGRRDIGVTEKITYEDKETSADPLFCKKKGYLEVRPGVKQKWLYFYRKANKTKKTVSGNHNLNAEYFYDVRQVNRCTSTCDLPFPGELLYPHEEPETADIEIQTDTCFTTNKCEYEITTTCISYANETNTTEIDDLPAITNPKDDYKCNVGYVQQNNEGTKTYMTKENGINIMAETVTANNFSEMNLVLSNDLTMTYTKTGTSKTTDARIDHLKQNVYFYARQIATNLMNERRDAQFSEKQPDHVKKS